MQKEKDNYSGLKKYCQGLGVDLFGVADVSKLRQEFLLAPGLREKFNSALSLAARVSGSVLDEIETHPTRLYFHHYRTLNAFLDQAALRVSNLIMAKGFLALPVPASQILDWNNQRAHLSHKKVAYLAGLGWIGRNNLLVNRSLGCQLRLVTVLTDMPIKTDKPTQENCADCRLCLKVCPADAIKDDPADFEHVRCLEKLKEFQKQRFVDQYICGICVKVCRFRKP